MKSKPPIFQNPLSDGGSFFMNGKIESDTAILLLHGFTATTVEVRTIAECLNGLGYTVSGPLLPGHGVSPDELNKASYQTWIAAAEGAYQELRANYKNVFVLGESMGGLLALWLGASHPEISGLLIFAPALKIPGLWQSIFTWPFKNHIFKKNIDLNSPWQGFNVIPLRAAYELYELQRKIKSKLHVVRQPMIVFQGKLDSTIDPISAIEVMEKVNSIDKELIWLSDSSHCILLDKQMETVKQIVQVFIKKQSE